VNEASVVELICDRRFFDEREVNVMSSIAYVVGSAEGRGCNASILGKKPPISHPLNCKEACPYGYDRPFCFPCYKKIMQGHKTERRG